MEVAIGLLIIALCRIIFLERKKKEHLNSINEYKNLYQSSLIEKESVQAQSNKYVEEMAKLQNELDSVKQTSVSLRNEKDKLQIKLNEWKNHYQSLLTEKNAVQSQAKKYLEEISKLIKALEETDKKLKFYQNIEEDSGKLNVSQDLQEREILLKEAKKQLEIARNEQEKTNTNYIDNKQKNKLLDSEQYSILNEIEQSNENFFITGRAGTGKSFLLDVFKMTTQKSNIVSAPTGVAALNVNGQTIHSVFGYDNLVKLDVNSISSQTIRLKSEKKLILKNVTTIIIDEISMVRADTFDKIDRILKAVNHNNLPFGGKQILLFGDLFQLPPVTKTKEEHDYLNDKYGGTLFFCSKAYKQGNFNFRELTINHRQKDDKVYFELLNRVRDGSMTIEDINLLNSRVEQDSSVYDRFTTILPNKDEVEKLNQYRINQLDTPEYTYEAKIILDKRANKTSELSDSFPFSSTLHLKKGALIMMVVNDPEHRWVNGTLGIVSELSKNSIFVSIDKRTYEINRFDFTQQEARYENGKIIYEDILKVTQYPLVLAYAMTIHKSQGMTYQNIVCDIEKCFADGQAYVALSRCANLNGLHLKKAISGASIHADKSVLDFYNTYSQNK